jgi:ribonuclease HII
MASTEPSMQPTRRSRAPLEWFLHPGRVEVGVDEAGRGCLAGPVFAAAVVWPAPGTERAASALSRPAELALVRDSKRLSAAQRRRAAEFVREHAVAWSVASCSAAEVDRLNILRASQAAMHKALDAVFASTSCEPEPEAILVDGSVFRAYISQRSDAFVPHACIVGGDNQYLSIAAASILAKKHRDAHVVEDMHPRHPQYSWERNKAYGTAEHMQAMRVHGLSPEHRLSFAPCRAIAAASLRRSAQEDDQVDEAA